ncbi:MAG: glycosyltransferase family 4 protein [Rhodobacteraceae bacterium]|nr:glycosyltransferase family 4 protein [Paracoccaceae bacterium]
MKIAYLTGEYPRATDTFILREVQGLRALGAEVITCSVRTTPPSQHVGPEQKAEAAATFKVLDTARRPLTLLRCHLQALRAPRRYFDALRLAWRTAPPGLRNLLFQMFYFAESAVLAAHLREAGVTHLHNHIAKSSCTLAMIASAMSGIRFSFTLHGPDIFFEPYHWRLDEKIARASFVACISDFCRSQAMAFSPPDHWSKLRIVHCGVEPDRYAPGPRAARPTLLFVGRLAAVKGVPVLFDAMADVIAAHPDVHLVLIGDGPERASLERQCARMGLSAHVTFAGYRSQAEVATALSETDIFVLPSFAEGVPVVLMEAMAAQVPVVTTRIAGVPELVQDGVSGLLVPPGAVAPLGEALRALLADADRRRAMGASGREKVTADYVSAQEAGKLLALFREAAGENAQ